MEDCDAWADESYAVVDGVGVYVIAAVTFESEDLDEVRSAMQDLRGQHPRTKVHWTKMEAAERVKATQQVADLGGFHVATVASAAAGPAWRPERARALCLTALVHELHGDGRRSLCFEARNVGQNKLDLETVKGARAQLGPGTIFHFTPTSGVLDEVLWVADIVAGSWRAGRQGQEQYREILADVVYEIDVPYTG